MMRLLLALGLLASVVEAQTTVTVTGDGAATVVTAGTQGPAGPNMSTTTLGEELAPALAAANWTCGAGWDCSVAGTISKNGDGLGTAAPNPALTITAGTTYRVTITVGAVSVAEGGLYGIGGSPGSALKAATTYTDYVTATTTGSLVIAPTLTETRFTITAVSVRALADGTGDLIVDGNLTVRSPTSGVVPMFGSLSGFRLYLPDQTIFDGTVVLGTGGAHLARDPEGAEENPIPDLNGQFNTFVGIGSGEANTVGTFNTFIGADAGQATTNGDQNTFVGGFAGQHNTTGYHNTYIGVGSGQNATTPSMNTFVGTDSGQYVITGAGHTMIGASSGGTTAGGLGSTYVGYAAGTRTGFSAASYNTAIGFNALGGGGAANDIHNMVAIGRNAGYQETQSSRFYVDNFARADLAAGRAGALLYGVMAEAVADQSLSINALHVNVDNIPTYANNAAALAGGLVAGDLYMVTGTDPRQIAVAF